MITSNNKKGNKKLRSRKGVALYVAVVITAGLVLASYAIITQAVKQLGITSSESDSQAAFYAADSGVECALFWDLKGGNVYTSSAFSTTTSGRQISCRADAFNPANANISIVPVGSDNATSTFTLTFIPDDYCVEVRVGKSYTGAALSTRIESRGYNNCSVSEQRKLERAIQVTY